MIQESKIRGDMIDIVDAMKRVLNDIDHVPALHRVMTVTIVKSPGGELYINYEYE